MRLPTQPTIIQSLYQLRNLPITAFLTPAISKSNFYSNEQVQVPNNQLFAGSFHDHSSRL